MLRPVLAGSGAGLGQHAPPLGRLSGLSLGRLLLPASRRLALDVVSICCCRPYASALAALPSAGLAMVCGRGPSAVALPHCWVFVLLAHAAALVSSAAAAAAWRRRLCH